jgi:hypothetical protein
MKAAKHGLAYGPPVRQLVLQRDIGRHRDSRPEASRHLDKIVHDAYFHPAHEEFNPRIMWSLSNAFTAVQVKPKRSEQHHPTERVSFVRV